MNYNNIPYFNNFSRAQKHIMSYQITKYYFYLMIIAKTTDLTSWYVMTENGHFYWTDTMWEHALPVKTEAAMNISNFFTNLLSSGFYLNNNTE